MHFMKNQQDTTTSSDLLTAHNGSAFGVAGLSVLDGIALVIGGAVASVHVRGPLLDQSSVLGWGVVMATFSGLAVTSTGPFLIAFRRALSRPPSITGLGERLWAVLGHPWVLAAPFHTLASSGRLRPFDVLLVLGLSCATIWVLVAIWRSWVRFPSEPVRSEPPPRAFERIGIVLAVGWPFQWGLLLIILGNHSSPPQ
jgi:hypothetical protein